MAAITAGTAPSYYATNMGNTAQSGNAKPVMLNVADVGGRMRVWYDTHVVGTTGTWALNGLVHVAVLPEMAKIWDVKLYQSATLGASKTVSVGYLPVDGATAGDDVKFEAATAATSAGWTFTGTIATGAVGFALPKESFITLKHAGGSGAASAATIQTIITYTID